MPDLNIESGYYCATNEDWETTVTGSRGDIYLVRWERSEGRDGEADFDWTCTCKGFEFHPDKPCKHIRQVAASDDRCAWNNEMTPCPEIKSCPKCNGPVRPFRIEV